MGERVQVGRVEPPADASAASPPPIDYGRSDPVGDRSRRFTGFFRERLDGLLEFVGQLIGALGGPRRVGFAIALACVAGGLGDCIRGGTAWGVFWMTIGGFWLAFYLPISRH